MSVTYSEEQGSPTETWDIESGITGHRKLRCPWTDRYDFAAELLLDEGAAYEPHGGSSILRAKRVLIQPFAAEQLGSATLAAYEDAILDVDYGTPERHKEGGGGAGNLYTESIEPQAEFITLPYSKYRWASSGKNLLPDDAPGKLHLNLDYILIRYGVAAIPSYSFDLVGKTNDAAFDTLMYGKTFAEETLLFNPPSFNRRVMSDMTTEGWDVTSRLSYNSDGWNKFWNGKIYDTIEERVSGDPYKNFPPDDFSVLVP